MIRCTRAGEQDKSFLRTLNREVYEPVVVKQFGTWNDAFQDRVFEEKWAVQNYQIVEHAGQRVGAIWVTKEPDHLWLREIQISPPYQNRGIGTKLLMKVMNEAAQSDLPLRLRVLIENRAKALYERHGFRDIGMFGNTHYWMEHTRPPQ